jgi:predicted RNA-binding Zn-ribbon protein involved in translation (DUF1610 family)
MRPIVYKCPRTGFNVQALVAEDLIESNMAHILVDCPMCNRQHLINPADCSNLNNDNVPDGPGHENPH